MKSATAFDRVFGTDLATSQGGPAIASTTAPAALASADPTAALATTPAAPTATPKKRRYGGRTQPKAPMNAEAEIFPGTLWAGRRASSEQYAAKVNLAPFTDSDGARRCGTTVTGKTTRNTKPAIANFLLEFMRLPDAQQPAEVLAAEAAAKYEAGLQTDKIRITQQRDNGRGESVVIVGMDASGGSGPKWMVRTPNGINLYTAQQVLALWPHDDTIVSQVPANDAATGVAFGQVRTTGGTDAGTVTRVWIGASLPNGKHIVWALTPSIVDRLGWRADISDSEIARIWPTATAEFHTGEQRALLCDTYNYVAPKVQSTLTLTNGVDAGQIRDSSSDAAGTVTRIRVVSLDSLTPGNYVIEACWPSIVGAIGWDCSLPAATIEAVWPTVNAACFGALPPKVDAAASCVPTTPGSQQVAASTGPVRLGQVRNRRDGTANESIGIVGYNPANGTYVYYHSTDGSYDFGGATALEMDYPVIASHPVTNSADAYVVVGQVRLGRPGYVRRAEVVCVDSRGAFTMRSLVPAGEPGAGWSGRLYAGIIVDNWPTVEPQALAQNAVAAALAEAVGVPAEQVVVVNDDAPETPPSEPTAEVEVTACPNDCAEAGHGHDALADDAPWQPSAVPDGLDVIDAALLGYMQRNPGHMALGVVRAVAEDMDANATDVMFCYEAMQAAGKAHAIVDDEGHTRWYAGPKPPPEPLKMADRDAVEAAILGYVGGFNVHGAPIVDVADHAFRATNAPNDIGFMGTFLAAYERLAEVGAIHARTVDNGDRVFPGPAPKAEPTKQTAVEAAIYNVRLDSVRPGEHPEGSRNFVHVIRALREISGCGLVEAKAFIDALPKVVLTGVSHERAMAVDKMLDDAGGNVTLEVLDTSKDDALLSLLDKWTADRIRVWCRDVPRDLETLYGIGGHVMTPANVIRVLALRAHNWGSADSKGLVK